MIVTSLMPGTLYGSSPPLSLPPFPPFFLSPFPLSFSLSHSHSLILSEIYHEGMLDFGKDFSAIT